MKVRHLVGVLWVSFVVPSAWAYLPTLPLPPALELPPQRFEMPRDAQGRVTRLTLPEGDSVTYDPEHGTRRHTRGRSELALQTSETVGLPLLSPDRIPLTTERLETLSLPIRAHEKYSDFLDEVRPAYIRTEADGGSTRMLSAEAKAGLLRQVALLDSCQPELAHALRTLIAADRIRHSPDCSEAAVADGQKNGVVYLSNDWVAALEGHSDFTPAVRWMQIRNEETAGIRRRYFGSDRVTFATLGSPSRSWLFLLGIVHEVGHLVQYEQERFAMAREVFTFDLLQITHMTMAQAMTGMIAPELQRRQAVLNRRMEPWKQSIESGATFFALDALASCPASLGGDAVPPYREAP